MIHTISVTLNYVHILQCKRILCERALNHLSYVTRRHLGLGKGKRVGASQKRVPLPTASIFSTRPNFCAAKKQKKKKYIYIFLERAEKAAETVVTQAVMCKVFRCIKQDAKTSTS